MSDMSYMHGPLGPQMPHEPQPLGPAQDPLTVLLAALTSSHPTRPSTPGLGQAPAPGPGGPAAGSSGSSALAAGSSGVAAGSGAGTDALVKCLNEAYERALVYVRKAGLEGTDQLHTLEVKGGGALRRFFN
jgi:hypothetical protein